MLNYPVDTQGRMELTMQQYAESPVWPCCGEAICKCGKARHPAPIRRLIAEAAEEDLRE